MIFIYKISNTSCIWHVMANHFTFYHSEEIKISLNEVLFYLPKPCFERAPSFSISGRVSGCQISLSSASGHTLILSFSSLFQSAQGWEPREPCLLEESVN